MTDANVLIIHNNTIQNENINYLKNNFCGKVCDNTFFSKDNSHLRAVYFCGDASIFQNYKYKKNIYVVKEYSHNYEFLSNEQVISYGEVPINIHNCGVMVRQFLNEDNYFNKLHEEHTFQNLTESNKKGKAHRKGIYLSKVKKDNNKIYFDLLRCSSNLSGPTDNFRKTDTKIISKANNLAKYFFKQKTDLNHVLAQVYHNFINDNGKECKAKIKAHSDKTKDMDPAGLIAFTTFYNTRLDEIDGVNKSKTDQFDYVYKDNVSVLTELKFNLKRDVIDPKYPKSFSVKLYPNSIFIIPLSINRIYTHEIKPSNLPINKLPIRLGYVIRCSNKKAYYDTANDQTMLDEGGKFIPLEKVTNTGEKELKTTYLEENITINKVKYNTFNFSFNEGDYMKPLI